MTHTMDYEISLGLIQLKLCFGNEKFILVGYTNPNMVRDIVLRISSLVYLIPFAGGVVAWQYRLQKCVALSITEFKSANHHGKNLTFHTRFKHINVRYQKIQEVLEAKLLKLEKIHTDNNGADILTLT
ncbi:hypothetical protein V6Z12_A08G195600 [Gossypium hirsutum]